MVSGKEGWQWTGQYLRTFWKHHVMLTVMFWCQFYLFYTHFLQIQTGWQTLSHLLPSLFFCFAHFYPYRKTWTRSGVLYQLFSSISILVSPALWSLHGPNLLTFQIYRKKSDYAPCLLWRNFCRKTEHISASELVSPEERCSEFFNIFFLKFPPPECLSREWSKNYVSSQALWRMF